MTEEKAEIVGKTWREVKAVAENSVHWQCFMEALCCKTE
jgi:predicted metal-dependent hydrolase